MLIKLWQRQASNLIGIDIGSHEIKAILLNKLSTGYSVQAHAAISLKKMAVIDHEIRDIDAITDALIKLKSCFPQPIKNAAVAISGAIVMTKTIAIPASLSDIEIETQVTIEAENMVSCSLDEVNLDFEITRINVHNPNMVDVLLSICRKEHIDALVDAFAAANIELSIVDIEAYALARASVLVKSQFNGYSSDDILALIDVGASTITLAITEQNSAVFTRELAFGCEQVTQAIMGNYNLSYVDAETAKITSSDFDSNFYDTLLPFQEQLLQQIKQTLQIYSGSSNRSVTHVAVCGGGANISGIDKLLTSELGINAVIANPFPEQPTPFYHYMVAIGLALRGVNNG